MNVDARDSVFNSHICFNALATLQHIKNVENSCSFCSATDHSTYVCPVLSQGEHVKDTSIENLSRSSVPHGLQVFEDDTGAHIISMQKFAKGCRFGPLLAPKSYVPLANIKFPLTIFGELMNLDVDAMNMPELKELFKVRNIYLDTRNEKYCNWMIHVDPAQYANEQNLVAYEEDNDIFFAAVEDLDVGDILKVWYSPMYGDRMKVAPLQVSTFPLLKNVLQQGNIILPEYQLFSNFGSVDDQTSNRTEISLPSIKNIIKPSAYVCYENRAYVATPIGLPSPFVARSSIEQVDHDPSFRLEDLKILNLDEPFALSTTHSSDIDAFGGSFEEDDDEPMRPATNGNGSSTSLSVTAGDKEDKKTYPCRLCDKKYSTMTNIYRHVRTQHNYFLCSLCMKMFELEAELKEHIHKCPKSDVKKPQCIVCMQYFSNSWSLTRHIKIHVSAGECNPDILLDRKIKEKKCKEDTKDSLDLSDLDRNSRDSLVNDLIGLVPEPSIQPLPVLCDFDIVPIENAPNASFLATNETNDGSCTTLEYGEVSACVVCSKRFKSAACMNKHLKSVHTVKVLASTKRPAPCSSHSKSSANTSKRSHSNESHSNITHTGLPVKPFTAKALASKLNERNQILNGTKNQTAKPSPIALRQAAAANATKTVSKAAAIPPLISLQTRTAGSLGNGQQTTIPNTTSSVTMNSTDDHDASDSVSTFNIFETNSNMTDDTNSATTNGNGNDFMADDAIMPDEQMLRPGKQHGCDLCGKKFNKKYELKRHTASHENENVTYKCPYCTKVVKRKTSILKHLRISHVELEDLWNKENFIDSLKRIVIVDIDETSNGDDFGGADDTSDDIHHSSNFVELDVQQSRKSTAHNRGKDCSVSTVNSSNATTTTNRTHDAANAARTNANATNNIKQNSIAANSSSSSGSSSKSKKSLAVLNYLKKMNVHEVKKYLIKNPQNTTEQIKKKVKLSANLSNRDPTQATDDRRKVHRTVSNTSNKRVDDNTSSSAFRHNHKSKLSLSSNRLAVANTPPLSPKITLHSQPIATSSTSSTAAVANSNNSNSHNAISASASATMNADDVNVNNIIDNCFFVDDTLNCNVVLHSPFSSDNDVDGFIMSNSIEGDHTVNSKELLNKFHDRLEEMEQKIEDSDFKVMWNQMLDDDDNENGINDQMADDDDVELNGRTGTNGNSIDTINGSNNGR